MAKSKKGKQAVISTKGMEAIEAILKPLEFTDATITDDFCNYTYKIKVGIGAGNSHNVKGSIIIHDDLKNAMEKLDKHIACVDMVYALSGTKFDNINQVENDELTAMYAVHGFSISGSEDHLSVVLSGDKRLTLGRVKLKTPKIEMSENSSYHWHEDLLECVERVRKEVQLYHEGKCTKEIETNDPAQIEVDFDLESAKAE
jgi:hypothetical protein